MSQRPKLLAGKKPTSTVCPWPSKLRLCLRDGLAEKISGVRSCPAGVFPFRLAQKPIGFVCYSGKPRQIGLRVVPRYICHRPVPASPAIVSRLKFEARRRRAPRPTPPQSREATNREGLRDRHLMPGALWLFALAILRPHQKPARLGSQPFPEQKAHPETPRPAANTPARAYLPSSNFERIFQSLAARR